MVYLILSILIAVSCYFLVSKIADDEDLACAIVQILCIIFVAVPVVNIFAGVHTTDEYLEQECLITGLEFKSSQENTINGMFVLGSGYITGTSKDKLKYVFFANGDYGKQLQAIDVKNTFLKETDEEEPKLINVKTKDVRKTNFIDYLWGNTAEEEVISEHIEKRILVIPKNTIKVDYNIEI